MQGGVLTAADVGGGASDVADPAVRVVILGTIGNAEVLNLEVGDVVHRDLESERDGADLAACLRGAAGAEANTCTKPTWETAQIARSSLIRRLGVCSASPIEPPLRSDLTLLRRVYSLLPANLLTVQMSARFAAS